MEDDPNVAFVGRNDGFVLQNARVGLAGTYDRWLAFRISADGAVDEREGRNATLGTLRFALKDAYADFRALPEVVVRGGRFKIIFDLDEIDDETQRRFVDEALETRGVFPTQGFETPGLAPGRSLGVAIRSDEALAFSDVKLGYEVAVQNGNGEFESANDSDLPAVSVALFARFPDRSFAFVAGRWKSRALGELPFRQTEVDYEGNAGALARRGDPLRRGARVLRCEARLRGRGAERQRRVRVRQRFRSAGGVGRAVRALPRPLVRVRGRPVEIAGPGGAAVPPDRGRLRGQRRGARGGRPGP
ncbi:MAG TPA: hypothetical protein VKE22_12800, partial [Haliangiales bacterium]|nr:hypothetical protein [Haliangiales bacterium]